MNRLCSALAVAALMAVVPSQIRAQDFPSRTIRIIQPAQAGSPTDIMSRFAAEEMGKRVNQSVIVENKPGAANMIGTKFVADAPADGHTVLVQPATIILNALTSKNAGYRVDQFTPLVPMGEIASALVVPAAFPANDLKQFISVVKAAPGKYSIGSNGGATVLQLWTDRMLSLASLDMLNVQYKGGADGVRGLLSGEINAHIIGVQLVYSHIQAGTLKAIAAIGDKRLRLLPNVATFQEQGIPDMETTAWVAAFARSDTPAPVLGQLRRLMEEAVTSPAYRDRLQAAGGDIWTPTGKALEAAIAHDLTLWQRDVARLKLEPR